MKGMGNKNREESQKSRGYLGGRRGRRGIKGKKSIKHVSIVPQTLVLLFCTGRGRQIKSWGGRDGGHCPGFVIGVIKKKAERAVWDQKNPRLTRQRPQKQLSACRAGRVEG